MLKRVDVAGNPKKKLKLKEPKTKKETKKLKD